MADILILMASHLCVTPRAWREANALASAGHRVRVAGVIVDQERYERDLRLLEGCSWELIRGVDLRSRTLRGKATWAYHRARVKLGRIAGAWGIPDPAVLGYAHDRLLATARRTRADLTIVHNELATWVGAKLLRDGRRLGADIEDWYSENDPVETFPPAYRSIVRTAERELLRGAAHRATTTRVLARALAAAYDVPEPVVVYNGTEPVREIPPRTLGGPTRFVWFSQTIGGGRGLSDLFSALARLTGEFLVTLIGNARPDTVAWIASALTPELRRRVTVQPPVPQWELSRHIAGNDVGLALELPRYKSRDLTATNKIFEYLQCGLVVVASATSGQREVAAMMPSATTLYASGDVAKLAAAMQGYIDRGEDVAAKRERISADANALFSTDAQALALTQSVDRALTVGRARAWGVAP